MNWKYNHPAQNLFSPALLIFAAAGFGVLCWFSKADIFWFLNHQHSVPGDMLLKYYTHVGDGLFMITLAVILFIAGKRKLGILLFLSFFLSGLFVQLVKRLEPEPRPGLYFSNEKPLQKTGTIHFIDGKLLMGRNSFPSGHTTTAFALFSLLAFATRNQFIQILFFLAALIVGYSRIYLGQHFFKDVLIGAVLGYGCSVFLFWLLRNKEFDR